MSAHVFVQSQRMYARRNRGVFAFVALLVPLFSSSFSPSKSNSV
jgi:hypothetical protein